MPGIRTDITEIVTGLGTLSYPSVLDALAARPHQLLNVDDQQWARLAHAASDPAYADDVDSAWENGRAFLEAGDGLRGRPPVTVEWKGPHHPPGYDFLPADLRIDNVFLISCKYLSKVLANPSPGHLFERALADRGSRSDTDWFMAVAEDAYRRFYKRVREELFSDVWLPTDLELLTPGDRDRIKALCARRWPAPLEGDYEMFSAEVSRRSAAVWAAAAPALADRELLLWRMLRFNSAPYFILGSAQRSHLRLRVATPWDWRQHFRLSDFTIAPSAGAQPRVNWSAVVRERVSGSDLEVDGHVEIRWSHGRFCGFPEAKLYLDSPHDSVPGYFPLK